MRAFGLEITRQKAVANLARPDDRGGWWRAVMESFTGAWQRNIEIKHEDVMSYHAVYACMTLIASDIAKLRIKLVEKGATGIWKETENPAFSPVLRKPNRHQTRIQFLESWVLSKLGRGNAYILKGRDDRGIVTTLHVLDPNLTFPLVADNGDVFYQLNADNVAGIESQVIVPAREIIHDRFNCIYHPLVGTSPLMACGLTATQGLSIQSTLTRTYQNGGITPGILSAPSAIEDATAQRLKEHWETNYTGDNAKKVAVLGDGLKFERMAMTSVEAQLIEQLKWTVEVICSVFHVPAYKVGIGAIPSSNNVEALGVEYYSQALQRLIEDIELCLDEGLGIGAKYGTELDLDNLLRMDSTALMKVVKEGAGVMKIDEQRHRLGLEPTVGGNTVYLQQQNYSLEALAKRDAGDDPFGKASATPEPSPPAAEEPKIDPSTAERLFAVSEAA
ncbi:HK97 family phage portal protein [Devosia sp. UYZn731]|uniref:phage portal protein n=1 Tax=Devosia sp. UYZn731 TaxID=3156345 RepID=UPI0033932358